MVGRRKCSDFIDSAVGVNWFRYLYLVEKFANSQKKLFISLLVLYCWIFLLSSFTNYKNFQFLMIWADLSFQEFSLNWFTTAGSEVEAQFREPKIQYFMKNITKQLSNIPILMNNTVSSVVRKWRSNQLNFKGPLLIKMIKNWLKVDQNLIDQFNTPVEFLDSNIVQKYRKWHTKSYQNLYKAGLISELILNDTKLALPNQTTIKAI